MELQEFRFTEGAKDQKWFTRWAVLFVDDVPGAFDDEHYEVIHGELATIPVHPDEIDHWIEMLQWMKAHQQKLGGTRQEREAIAAGDAEKMIDPRSLLDSDGVTEEDG